MQNGTMQVSRPLRYVAEVAVPLHTASEWLLRNSSEPMPSAMPMVVRRNGGCSTTRGISRQVLQVGCSLAKTDYKAS